MLNHNKRENYEKYYLKLCKEANEKAYHKYQKLSDFALLLKMNELLMKLNCQPMNEDELEINLV